MNSCCDGYYIRKACRDARAIIERQANELAKCGGLAEWRRLMSTLSDKPLGFRTSDTAQRLPDGGAIQKQDSE
jgi:hypothetical protein